MIHFLKIYYNALYIENLYLVFFILNYDLFIVHQLRKKWKQLSNLIYDLTKRKKPLIYIVLIKNITDVLPNYVHRVARDILNFVKTKNLKRVPPQQIDLPPRLEVSAPEAVEPPTPAAATTVTPSVTPAQPPEGQTHLDIELTNMRKTIAKRLTESKVMINLTD